MRQHVAFLLALVAVSASAASAAQKGDIADVSIGGTGVVWNPRAPYPGLSLSVATPDGQVLQETFTGGVAPSLDLSGSYVPDGQYTWELRVVAGDLAVVREGDAEGPSAAMSSSVPLLTQTGSFRVSQGVPLAPSGAEETSTKLLHSEDVYIDGRLGVGHSITGSEVFDLDTVVMKADKLQVFFDDTSGTLPGFPENDWRLRVNDLDEGGADYFAIEDATAEIQVFRVEAGAPANSLYVDDHGKLGLGTATPAMELHVVDDDSPAIRLEQTATSWTPQTWDIRGNETNFYIRDVTHGSRLPFRIQPDAPNNALTVKESGNVGIGTWTPGWPLTVETTGKAAQLVLDRTDGGLAYMGAGHTYINMGSGSAHPLRLMVNGTSKMAIGTDGHVGIGTDSPGFPLEVETTGEPALFVLNRTDGAMAYMGAGHTFVNMGSASWNHLRLMVNGACKTQINTDGTLHMASGAYCNIGGKWIDSSSREVKADIKDLTTDEAVEALAGLEPVKYCYKADSSDQHVGFIAEDVPDLVAAKDRKGMSAMDVTAVLTKVLQEQQRLVEEQQREITELRSRLESLERETRL